MKLLDLTELYCRTVATDGNWRSYEEHSPALFEHYFRFWAKRSFPDVKIPVDVLKTRSELVKRRLPMIIRRFNKKGLDIGKFRFVLFVGKNCTNGHAFRDAVGWVVWIPVESYASRPLSRCIRHARDRACPALREFTAILFRYKTGTTKLLPAIAH